MGVLLGVDEAGRGPVLGPMVMAACTIEEDHVSKLVELGVKDSKLIPPKERERLAKKIRALCEVAVSVVPPTEVDSAVNSKQDNLNFVEARHTAQLIETLSKKNEVSMAYVDCPSTNTKKYTQTLQGLLKQDVPMRCEHKADAKYPIAAAASIIAKTVRDDEMKRISELAGHDLGSGYMTDPKTHSWLQEHYDGGYGFIRRSWAPVKELNRARGQKSLKEFEEKKEEHKQILEEFEKLEEFGFRYDEPKNHYEIVRMRGPEHVPATIIRYTSGKLLVQGNNDAKKKANALLQTVGLL